MKLQEIKKAVDQGKPVRWASDIYHVEDWGEQGYRHKMYFKQPRYWFNTHG